jgi:hypothetical protein
MHQHFRMDVFTAVDPIMVTELVTGTGSEVMTPGAG